jgi:hypothetical protein
MLVDVGRLWAIAMCSLWLAGCSLLVGDDVGSEVDASEVDARGGDPEQSLRIFVTSEQVQGDLATDEATVDGLAAGDALCKRLADDASLGGEFLAWLSDGSADAFNRIPDSGKSWRLPRGDLVFRDRDAITSSAGPEVGITETEGGAPLAGQIVVWTGTDAGGVASNTTCQDWTSSDSGSSGTVGFTDDANGSNFTSADTANCDQSRRLLCFGI